MPPYMHWDGAEGAPLYKIQDWACANLRPGHICPGCGQHARDRRLGWHTMRTVVRAYAIHKQNEFHLPPDEF